MQRLRPRFLAADRYDQLRAGISAAAPGVRHRLDAALGDAGFREQFHLLDWERTLALERSGDPRESRCPGSMPSSKRRTGRLLFTEYNAETPAGSAYHDALSELFLSIPATRPFLRSDLLRPLPARHNVLHALLLELCRMVGAPRGAGHRHPRLERGPYPERVPLYRDFFEAMGIRCVVADVRACTLKADASWPSGTLIDLIYKRVLIGELSDGKAWTTRSCARCGAARCAW